jgi:hypothetical protein
MEGGGGGGGEAREEAKGGGDLTNSLTKHGEVEGENRPHATPGTWE